MANREHLLVPIKVQALVIDNLVIDKRGALKNEDKKYVANDGKWSPLQNNYSPMINMLAPPGPLPFYGADHKYDNQPTDQLLLPANSPALPEMKHRGVYLHWVLPSGLRHAYTPGSLDFPALPDQWLIVRYCRRGADLKTNAWFIDGGLVVDSPDPANLLLANGDKYVARRVGKAVPLNDYEPANFKGDRTTITAIGNAETGSPTFTASVAENRNILSWHDDLNDLRENTAETKIPRETVLSYLLLGWYLKDKNEPLSTIPVQLIDENLLDPPGWLIDSASPLRLDELKKRRCLFHGMVAHINYWSSGYKGPMLGYPGSPSVDGVFGGAPPSFKVGVGNNAEDALVSLVSSEYSGKNDAPNLWKALEAVIYRQPESLVGSWNAAPRDAAVHQSWFSTVEAGKVWSIHPRPGQKSPLSADPLATDRQAGAELTPEQLAALKHLSELQSTADAATARQAAVKPTPEQLAELKQINELQSAADAVSRQMGALQQDLYARWWKLSEQSRFDKLDTPDDEAAACSALMERVSTLRNERDGLLKRLQPLPETLKKKLPEELELRSDAAPRFWTPADPVIVVKNCGLPTKHQSPPKLLCRLSEETVTAAEVKVEKTTPKQFKPDASESNMATAVWQRFVPHSEILARMLKSMIEEASVVEQAISDLAVRTLQAEGQPFSATKWLEWTKRLVNDMTLDGKSDPLPRDQILFGKSNTLNMRAYRLAELWGQQPWSPLFLDWEIKWYPTTPSGQDFGPTWRLGEHDYKPADEQPLPTKGFTVRGRSLLSPIDGRIFNKPIETLRELLDGLPDQENKRKDNPAFPLAVAEILSRYKMVWDKTLGDLSSAGMMGQALTGFHQALLHRDVTLPRVMPDPQRPWIYTDDFKPLERDVERLLAPDKTALDGERLAPPAHPPRIKSDALPFTMLRAGAFRITELWLVDDFGQWADLLRGTFAGGAAGQVFHPRVRWDDDSFVIAMPPRVVQPVRLNFRFTAADNQRVESDSDPALSPICGWIFYNPLDRALVFCDRDGQIAGEIVTTEVENEFRVKWQAGAGGVALDEVRNPSLKAFAESLIETKPTTNPRLHELLKLIDRALERIRPAATQRERALFGRPLALVSTMLGLELFGKAWTDPHDDPSQLEGTGNAALNKLLVRVNLGCSHNTEDGLIGYFKGGNYTRIVPAPLPKKIDPTAYIGDAVNDAEHVGFTESKPLTLLMDPWGSVQAASGLVPAKTITLAQPELDKTLARMEASFRVGPVLLQADRLALPTPVGDKRRWNFYGPFTNNVAVAVIPSDAKEFSDQPVVAAEGRLLLLTTEE